MKCAIENTVFLLRLWRITGHNEMYVYLSHNGKLQSSLFIKYTSILAFMAGHDFVSSGSTWFSTLIVKFPNQRHSFS